MKKILICEDEPEVLEFVTNLLVKRGYTVETVGDGQKAIEKTKELNPDLIILDIRMPQIDGIEAAKQIRSFNNTAKIVFITSFQSPELLKEANKYNIVDYIVKPITTDQLLKIVEQTLE